ncbi:RNA methyltransferase [Candidatus Saganbacteria bacterium]|nr:RNA methyltransferase [Candidatus Saganbacteria bacterium]
MAPKIYIALLHHPVYNKRKEVVTTCITGFDLHDIARTALTYGVAKYFVINPLPAQIKFAQRILNCWKSEKSFVNNWTRAEAFSRMEIKKSLDEAIKKIGNPIIVATSARRLNKSVSFDALKAKIKKRGRPYLFLFGTGWGMTEELLDRADMVLAPVKGRGSYNHLSVRAAVAIILDRLFGR